MNKKAFTLIELSVVMVIIGLLVGSTVVGRSLITDARIRTVMKEAETYVSAFGVFVNTYGCVPGDCLTATTFFGATDANSNTIYNGNGDGQVDTMQENFNAWQHLMAAQLISGNYDGGASVASASFKIGINMVPSGYSPNTFILIKSETLWGNYLDSNQVVFASIGAGALTTYETFTVLDTSIIDLKTDDGMPYTGRTLGYSYVQGNGNCVATAYINSPAHSLPYLPLTSTYCMMSFAAQGTLYK